MGTRKASRYALKVSAQRNGKFRKTSPFADDHVPNIWHPMAVSIAESLSGYRERDDRRRERRDAFPPLQDEPILRLG